MRVRIPTMRKKLNVPEPPIQLVQSTSAFAPQMTLTQSTPVIAEQIIREPPQRPRRKTTTKATESQQPPQKRHRTSSSITDSYGLNTNMPLNFISQQSTVETKTPTDAEAKTVRKQMNNLDYSEKRSPNPRGTILGSSNWNMLTGSTICDSALCFTNL